MPIQREVNKQFFKSWSHDMAYVLGYLMADGSITVNPRGSEYIDVESIDKHLIESVRNVLESDHKITRRERKDTTSFRLQIGSKNMCQDLRDLGMKEKKSHTMELPDIPEDYFGDYVRGFFDGDGSVWVGDIHNQRSTQTTVVVTKFITASRQFLMSLRDALSSRAGLGAGYMREHQRAYRVQYSVHDSLLLAELMYDNVSNGLCLERKRKKFEKYRKQRARKI